MKRKISTMVIMHLRWPRLALVATCVCGVLSSAGCGSEQQASVTQGPATATQRVLYGPSGIAVHERWVLVTNTAFHYEDEQPSYGVGFVTVIDRATRKVVATVSTSASNPQHVVVRGEIAYVVDTGTYAVDPARGVARITSAGALDVIALDAAQPPASLSKAITLGMSSVDDRIGGYGALAVDNEGGRALVGSGTRGDVFSVDLKQAQVLRGPDDPIALFPTPADRNGLTVVRQVGSEMAVLNFNADTLCLAARWEDIEAQQLDCKTVGINSDLLEGPIDVAPTGDGRLLVLMSLANAVYRVDPRSDPPQIDAPFVGTGLASNRLLVRGRYAYVINSLSNNLQRIDLETGETQLPFVAFPAGSNPYDVVVSDEAEGEVAWVTLWGTHQVALVDLREGKVIETIGPFAALPNAATADSASDAGTSTVGAEVDASAEPGPCLHPAIVAQNIIGIGNIVSASFGEGSGYGQDQLPAIIQGGPHGLGQTQGTTTGVLSLGVGGELIVDFGPYEIVDEPGPDLIVFENAFETAPYQSFAEPAVVGISEDDTTSSSFVDFPCDLETNVGDASQQRWPYPGCAGVRPTLANVETNCIDPTDPAVAGGDAFDLADLGLTRARRLRLRDGGVSLMGTNTKGFDLDAIVLVHYRLREN